MLKNVFFSSRVRQLRESHQLSLAQLSDILGKKRSAISDIESGRIGTTLEVLTDLADFFAVSVDWLLGRTETPYVPEVIERIELNMSNLYKSISLDSNVNLIYFKSVVLLHLNHLDDDYFKYANEFDLEQRANVIYALNFWKYAANKLNDEGFDSQSTSYENALRQIEDKDKESLSAYVTKFIEKLSGKSSSKRAGTAFVALCHQCLDILDAAGHKLPDIRDKITMEQLKNYNAKNKPSAE